MRPKLFYFILFFLSCIQIVNELHHKRNKNLSTCLSVSLTARPPRTLRRQQTHWHPTSPLPYFRTGLNDWQGEHRI
ncbi:hypothetical protein F4824DRAFT_469701, partial [Ustulina deusta]